MGKTRGVHETTPELRNRMIGMYEAGLGLRDIAAAVNCSQRTVKRWLNRFDREGTVETRERCGRKRATTSEQDEAIIKLATQTPITAAKTVLPALGLSCSVDTVRERLHKAGIHSWSPSRKHIQRMDAGGVSIHQAVWRPTGTLLGRKRTKKSSDKSTNKKPNKPIIPSTKKKKKLPPKKKPTEENDLNSVDEIVDNNILPSEEAIKEPVIQPGLSYSSIEYTVPVTDVPSRAISISNDSDNPQNNNNNHQIQYSNALELAEPSMPMYQTHQQQLNESQNWPLDLVQSNHQHHYQDNSQNSVSPEPHLHELYPAPRNHSLEQSQQHNSLIQNQQLHPHHHPHQLSNQQHHKQVNEIIGNSVNTLNGSEKQIDSNSDNCSSSNLSIGDRDLSKEDEDDDDDEFSGDENGMNKKTNEIDCSNKKKGGKAKGTLETSVEIRNRMIGMSEAGLSTLSIALAINRSERTVKRWLERWKKEGNVQTKERKGRRRITTKEQDDAIIQMATENPLTAAKLVAPALGLNCSVDTIRERLHKAGIHSWKLGKKQGEGNALHTVHLWQPSGNRVNKPKQITDKKKKPAVKKKEEKTNDIISTSTKKYSPKKKKLETTKVQSVQEPLSLPAPVNIIPEQSSMQFHNSEAVPSYVPEQSLMQRVELPAISSLVGSTVTPSPPSPAASIVTLESMMQQPRPDCRMTSGPPGNLLPAQSSLAYSSCMIANNPHPSHIDHQHPDPLNYEPYMWNFQMEFSNV